MKLDIDLRKNMRLLTEVFTDVGDVVKRKLEVGDDKEIFVMYLDNLINRNLIEERILLNLQVYLADKLLKASNTKEKIYNIILQNGITTADIKENDDFDEVVTAVLTGDTILLLDGESQAIIISSKGFPHRGVNQSDTEVLIQGPKDAFTETFRINTVLIRRRIRDQKLKLQQIRIGRRSKTDIAIMYLDDVVRPDVLKETIRRLKGIEDMDAIIDSGQLEQFLEEDYLSPFPQMQLTERPDKASAAILEGRIVILVDNTPFVIIVPATLNTFYQSTDDYYQRWEIVSFVRSIRYIAGFFAMALPGIYLALTVYHPSMIPMALALKIAGARMDVPFPAVIEILIMELAFELLREAGIRLPAPVGSTIGIVGGVIIGQAVVEAGIISPIVVVVVAITGIASFAIPSVSLVAGYRLVKYFVIIMSSIFGLYGFLISIFFIVTHLVNLKSFGIPYMFPYCSGDENDYFDLKDTILRVPVFLLERRPIFANPSQRYRFRADKNTKIRRW